MGGSQGMWDLGHILIALVMVIHVSLTNESYQPGYCQVYSYNLKQRHARHEERHFFVCCNNMDEKSCQGWTYQKPSRTESFCSGQVIQSEGSHWTQMETSAFPDLGRFYCGGCCGQHLAWQTCNEQLQGKWPGCMNWVQCFQRECRNIVAALLANQPLRCSLPPPPYPKHFRQEPRTLPANLSLDMTTVSSTTPVRPLQAHNASCTQEWCESVDLDQRCRTHCCQKYCCLPDGQQLYGQHTLLWGLTTIQIVGIAIGSLALMAALVAIIMLLLRRCIPGCKNFKMPSNDTQILVIEGPEDVESDLDSG